MVLSRTLYVTGQDEWSAWLVVGHDCNDEWGGSPEPPGRVRRPVPLVKTGGADY